MHGQNSAEPGGAARFRLRFSLDGRERIWNASGMKAAALLVLVFVLGIVAGQAFGREGDV